MREIDLEKCELSPKKWEGCLKIVYKDEPKSVYYHQLNDDEVKVLKYLFFKEWSNQSPTSQTSPKGDFSNEKEHNISLKESSSEDSQISSKDETSLNKNIKRNFKNK